MSDWPTIAEPELLARLAMSDREFEAYLLELARQIPPRSYESAFYERAIAYPWLRPADSFHLADGELELLGDLPEGERDRLFDRFARAAGRLPVLAIGSNGAPSVLERKLAHFPDPADRSLLALTGRLHDFDVGASAHLALYGAMPATLFPSPGTAVCVTVLWVTPAQFTQLAWSEINYRLGRLRTPFTIDDDSASFDEILVFVSRFGSFCIGGAPVALAAIPASGRTADALTQEQLLDAAAKLAFGPGATAEALVHAVFEDLVRVGPRIAATVGAAAQPFASERWTAFSQPG